MNLFPRTCLLGACALAMTAGMASAQRQTDTVGDIVIAGDSNRTVDMSWLRNNGASWSGSTQGMAIGTRVAAAGDANGDGIGDMLVSGFEPAPSNNMKGKNSSPDTAAPPAGVIYLVFGADHALPEAATLSAMNDGSTSSAGNTRGTGASMGGQITVGNGDQGFVRLIASGAGAEAGAALGHLDFNGDTRSDLIIGAPGADGVNGMDSGVVYIVFGRDEWPETLNLNAMGLDDGLILHGVHANDRIGTSVAGVGDFNGDGFEDALLGAPFASALDGASGPLSGPMGAMGNMGGPTEGGAAWLVFGVPRLHTGIALDRLTNHQGMVLTGARPGDHAGAALARAGDVDGDGFDDLLIGAPDAAPGGVDLAGEAYVVFGGPALPATVDLGQLTQLGVTIRGQQAGEQLGTAVAGGSDLNADGYADFALGAPGFDRNPTFGAGNEGRTVVVLGSHITAPVINLNGNPDSILGGNGGAGFSSGGGGRPDQGTTGVVDVKNGFELHTVMGTMPNDMLGTGLAMGGNLHGDGFDDLLMAAGGDASTYLLNGHSDMADSMGLADIGYRGLELVPSHGGPSPVAFVGDMNGDGYDDIAMGGPTVGGDAGEVRVLKGCANFALAIGDLHANKNFTMVLHGTPNTSWLLLASDSGLPKPEQSWRGDYWLGPHTLEVLMGAYDAQGRSEFPVFIPNAGFENLPVYWQAITLPQGNGQDLTGLMVTEVTFPGL